MKINPAKILFIGLLAVTFHISAQPTNPSIIPVTTAPSGSCSAGLPNRQVTSTGVQYTCQSGTWAAIGGGSGGPFLPANGCTSTAGGNINCPGTVAAGTAVLGANIVKYIPDDANTVSHVVFTPSGLVDSFAPNWTYPLQPEVLSVRSFAFIAF